MFGIRVHTSRVLQADVVRLHMEARMARGSRRTPHYDIWAALRNSRDRKLLEDVEDKRHAEWLVQPEP